MSITNAMNRLGPGAVVTYIGQEPDGWHCELTLPLERYSVSLVTAGGIDPDEALQNTVTRALTMFVKEQEGDKEMIGLRSRIGIAVHDARHGMAIDEATERILALIAEDLSNR